MRSLLLVVVLSFPVLTGAECEEERLRGLDNGLMITSDGNELCGTCESQGPWTVIGDPTTITFPEEFSEACEDIRVFGEERIERCELNQEDYDFHSNIITQTVRDRVVLVDMELMDEMYGGVTEWGADSTGCLLLADIHLNYDVFSGRLFRDRLKHELGHALFGLAHDEQSMDLNSCMSSPVPRSLDCEFTAWDIERASECGQGL